MEQLETIKGRSVVVPKLVMRYIIMFYDVNIGWQSNGSVYTTPESAIQCFIEAQNRYPNTNIKYYKAVEVELEIPFVPTEKKG